MNIAKRNSPALGVDPNVASALMQLYVAGQQAEDGHMPNLMTTNGVRVAIEPGTGVVSLAYRNLACELMPEEAYELATMMIAAADALRKINDSDPESVGYEAVSTSLSVLKKVADSPLS